MASRKVTRPQCKTSTQSFRSFIRGQQTARDNLCSMSSYMVIIKGIPSMEYQNSLHKAHQIPFFARPTVAKNVWDTPGSPTSPSLNSSRSSNFIPGQRHTMWLCYDSKVFLWDIHTHTHLVYSFIKWQSLSCLLIVCHEDGRVLKCSTLQNEKRINIQSAS